MKKKSLLLVALFLGTLVKSQTTEVFKPYGKPLATIYSYYRFDMTNGTTQKSKFDIYRAYLGYKYNFSKTISTKIVLDVGKGKVSSYSAYLKNAQLNWQMHKRVKLTFGMMGLTQHKHQEKFYGYRYILKTIQDDKGLSTSAALGVSLHILLHEKLKLDVFMLNAEGYKNPQNKFEEHRYGATLSTNPTEQLQLMVYYNLIPSEQYILVGNASPFLKNVLVSNVSVFAGYKLTDNFRIGAEYNFMNNAIKYSTVYNGAQLTGISAFSTFSFSDKWELFLRFDYLNSNTFKGFGYSWNFENDGNLYMSGVQYSLIKGVKMAANYRYYKYQAKDINSNSMIYLNFEYKF